MVYNPKLGDICSADCDLDGRFYKCIFQCKAKEINSNINEKIKTNPAFVFSENRKHHYFIVVSSTEYNKVSPFIEVIPLTSKDSNAFGQEYGEKLDLELIKERKSPFDKNPANSDPSIILPDKICRIPKEALSKGKPDRCGFLDEKYYENIRKLINKFILVNVSSPYSV